MPDTEIRSATFDDITIRSDADRPIRFAGTAATFGTRTWIGPEETGFFEELAPGAFDRALADESDVRLLGEHDPARLLARTANGSLRLRSHKKGLQVEADMIPTSYARDLALLLGTRTISEMSFGFVPRVQQWTRTKDGKDLRILEDVDLYDVSIVAFPAYSNTEASLRAVEARRHEIRTERLTVIRRRLEQIKGVS